MSIIKKNLIYNTILSLSQVLFPLITFPYVSRVLGPKGLGEFTYIDSIVQYFILFSALGIPLYGVSQMSKVINSKIEKNKLFTELILTQLISTFLSLFIYLFIYFFFKTNVSSSFMVIGALYIITNVFLVEWFFQAEGKIDYITKRTLVLRVIFLIGLFFFVKTEQDVILYYILYFLQLLLNALFNISYLYKSGITLIFYNINLKKHLKPLLFLTLSSIVGSIYILFDNILLGILGTQESLGIYSTAIKISKVPISLISSLGIVILPLISQYFEQKNLKQVNYYLDKSINYIITLSIPLSIGVALTAKWIVLIISGNRFYDSILLTQIMSPIIVFIALNSLFFFQVFTPGNQEKVMLKILLFCSIISLILNITLIPQISHIGAAITTLITELFVLIFSCFFAKRLYNVSIRKEYVFKALLSSMIFVPIIYFIDFIINADSNFTKLLLSLIFCTFSYYLIQKFIFKNLIIDSFESYFFKTKLS